jgi:uncharacterized protein
MNLEKYGPWALVIGGSEGIGAAFARKLAAKQFNIALGARKEPPLVELATELRAIGVDVRTLSADLSKADVPDEVQTLTADIEIGFLIYVAGANSIRGNIVDLDPQVYRSVIAVNVLDPVEFVRHYGARMKTRGHAGIILTGSSSNYIASATLGAYTASKAFSRIFSESLWAECKPMGIDVLHGDQFYRDPGHAAVGTRHFHRTTPERRRARGVGQHGERALTSDSRPGEG